MCSPPATRGGSSAFFINGTKVAGEQTLDQLAAALKK